MKNPIVTLIYMAIVAIVVVLFMPPPSMKEVIAGAVILAGLGYLFDKYIF